jgi:hypothetical protein
MVCFGAAAARQQTLKPLYQDQLFNTDISGLGI